MPKLKLSYFDFHGGRGEPARLALAIAGIPFEDDRFPFAEWPERKKTTPFGAVPVLEVDEKRVSQSNGINRYVGKLAGLYPEDAYQAALCDEVMDAVEDISVKLIDTFSMKGDELKAAREKLAEGPIRFYLERVNRLLEERGSDYFADGRLTVGDLKVFVWIRHLKSGNLDHVSPEIVDKYAPKLSAHFERVKSHPKIVAYYAK